MPRSFDAGPPGSCKIRHKLGYVEGKNVVFEEKFAGCQYERMAGLARDLVQVPVDVLFVMGTRAGRIVAGAVKTTPVVIYSCDPFEHVTRLARPDGNVTGVTCMTTELSPKRLGQEWHVTRAGDGLNWYLLYWAHDVAALGKLIAQRHPELSSCPSLRGAIPCRLKGVGFTDPLSGTL
jgi:hypothetical protein